MTSNLNADIKKIASSFDTSNYPKDHPLFSPHGNQRLGFFKNEIPPPRKILLYLGLKSKCYMLLDDTFLNELRKNSSLVSTKGSTLKCKAVMASVLNNMLGVGSYLRCLLQDKTIYAEFRTIRSQKHVVTINKIRKIGFTPFDNKTQCANCSLHLSVRGGCNLDEMGVLNSMECLCGIVNPL